MSSERGTSTITLPLVKLIDWILALPLMIKVFSLTSPEIVVHWPPLRVTVDLGAFNVILTSSPSAFLFFTVIGASELDVTVAPSTNFALIILYSVYSAKNLAIGLLACYNNKKYESIDFVDCEEHDGCFDEFP